MDARLIMLLHSLQALTVLLYFSSLVCTKTHMNFMCAYSIVKFPEVNERLHVQP